MINLKENVSAITLRGGKQLDEIPLKAKETKGETKQQEDSSVDKDEDTALIESMGPPKKIFKDPIPPVVPALPFPSHFAKTKKEENEKEILDTFQKVQVNIPILDGIKQVPRYTKNWLFSKRNFL